MHGSDREFACMKRIVSILCPEFDEPPAPARFTKTFHVYQEDMTSAPVRHHQAISNAHIHTCMQLAVRPDRFSENASASNLSAPIGPICGQVSASTRHAW